MSEHKLSDQLQIPLEDAAQLINKFFSSFPAIRAFLSNLGNFATSYGYIMTFPPYYRRRWFDAWGPGMDFKSKGDIDRAGKNTPIQGSAADMTKRAMCLVRRAIRDENWPVKMVMTVHDQIDTECLKERAEEWKIRFTELMEESTLEIIPSGLLKAETEISEVWKK